MPGCWAPRPHWHGHHPCSWSDHLPASRLCHSSALREIRIWDPCRDSRTRRSHLLGLGSFSSPPGLCTVHSSRLWPALRQAQHLSRASPPVSRLPGFLCFNPFSGGCLLLNYAYPFLCVTNLDSILKSRDITLPTKAHIVEAMVFPVVMCGCESWTIKKAEHRRIDTFELWCWRRLLRVPWTAKRSNQPILKEISTVYSLEGLMLKLKLQYFSHLMRRADSLEKTLMLGKLKAGGEGDERG